MGGLDYRLKELLAATSLPVGYSSHFGRRLAERAGPSGAM
jgi:hypothetical protein